MIYSAQYTGDILHNFVHTYIYEDVDLSTRISDILSGAVYDEGAVYMNLKTSG